jgi:hypothetical protein
MQSQGGSKRGAGGVGSIVSEAVALTDVVRRSLLSREVSFDPTTRIGTKKKPPEVAITAVKQYGRGAAFGTARDAAKKVLSIHNACGGSAHGHPNDCRELRAANGLTTNDLSACQSRVTSFRVSYDGPSCTSKKGISRHDATTISPNFFRQLARRRPSGGCLSGELRSNQSRVRREDASEEGLLAYNVGQGTTSVGTKSRNPLIVPARAGPESMINVFYCKLAVGTQFATMNPAGGNRLSDGASCLNDAEGGLARLRSRGAVERHRGTTIDANDKVVIGGPARGQAPQTKGRERREQELTNVRGGRGQ